MKDISKLHFRVSWFNPKKSISTNINATKRVICLSLECVEDKSIKYRTYICPGFRNNEKWLRWKDKHDIITNLTVLEGKDKIVDADSDVVIDNDFIFKKEQQKVDESMVLDW